VIDNNCCAGRRERVDSNFSRRILNVLGGIALLTLTGCALVGPDYRRPEVKMAPEWLNAKNAGMTDSVDPHKQWWQSFDDPVLDQLIMQAFDQNLDLQIAGLRILEARAQLGISTGNLYPQQQSLGAQVAAVGVSEHSANTAGGDLIYGNSSVGFDAAWELDFWGKFRRGVQAADAGLLATIADYDSFLITLTAEVARSYILIRTLEERIRVSEANVAIQQRSADITQTRFDSGLVTELDVQQARNLLANTQAIIPTFKASLRQAKNSLAVLLAISPQQIDQLVPQAGTIPQTPTSIAVGIPAELLRRRPDIRQAELRAMAQSALVGVSKADLFPHFSLIGQIGLVASDSPLTRQGGSDFGDLVSRDSVNYFAGPSIKWDVLNYGRIRNQVRVQDARLQQLLVNYQNTVLRAAQDVEDALTGLVNDRERLLYLHQAVGAAQRSVDIALLQYREGLVDFQRVLDTQRGLSEAQDRFTATRGSLALNMVGVYKSLGGGWQLREGKPVISPAAQEQMKQRTDWGGMLSEPI